MGIKQLVKVLEKHAKNGIIKNHISDFKNKRIAIDFSNLIYKIIYTGKKNNREDYHYISELANITRNFLKNNITPIYVFDGEPPSVKNDEIQKRVDERNNTEEKVRKLEILRKQIVIPERNNERIAALDKYREITEQIHKLSTRCLYVTEEHIKLSKCLFKFNGIPYLQAPNEADYMCGYLSKKGLVEGCLSEDMDFLAYGVKKLLRNYNIFNGRLNEYNLDIILDDMEMTHSEFIDLCILCGTDYHTIRGMGPVSAHKFIKNHGKLENIIPLLENSKFVVPDNFDYHEIRDIFNLSEDIDITNDIDFGDVNEEMLAKLSKKTKIDYKKLYLRD